MKREYFYEGHKAEQRGFYFLAIPMMILILVGGYFLTKDQPHESDVHKEYEKQRNIWYHQHGYIDQDFTIDTTVDYSTLNYNF